MDKSLVPHHDHRQDEGDRGDGEEGEGGEESQMSHLRTNLHNIAHYSFNTCATIPQAIRLVGMFSKRKRPI